MRFIKNDYTSRFGGYKYTNAFPEYINLLFIYSIDPYILSGYPYSIMNFDSISRKNFFKLIGVGITGYSLQSATLIKKLVDFPNYERLGRVCILGKVEIKSQPSDDSQTVVSSMRML